MCQCSRRRFLGLAAALPFAASACRRQTEGPEEIVFGRDVCAMCGMIISDHRFAAEIRGGPRGELAKFDDIGDAVNWLETQTWKSTHLSEFWVMDWESGAKWLDARTARYLPDVISPMDYGYAAVAREQERTVGFSAMAKAALAKGVSSRCPPPPGEAAGS
jgi:nitrous oxide reductase accessory protein NosL